MTKTQVLVVGAGPIGLSAAILLDQQGIETTLIDSKIDFSNHPRARLYDTISAELFRQFGVANNVAATDLGHDWTEHITVAQTIAGKQIARIKAPEFWSEKRPISSEAPVMTSQDLLEPILYERAKQDKKVNVLLGHEFLSLEQDENGCVVKMRDVSSREELEIQADYVIGADGSRSPVRKAIGAHLEGETRDIHFRDVLFHADMKKWIDDLDRKAGLLFMSHKMGGGVFQPLDGDRRWRVQIGGTKPDDDIADSWVVDWIRSAIGADEAFPIELESGLVWRVSARVANKFREGRVLLAGDAAHVFTPTGGMGTNCGLAGIHNMAWKVAYVVKGMAPASILDTYEDEWGPQAQKRTSQALENADYIGAVVRAHFNGGDLDKAVENVKQYTHYAGLIIGYELDTPLCQKDPAAPPAVKDHNEYVPVVRSGRRIPHIWLDDGEKKAIGDLLGAEYVVLLGADADTAAWTSAVEVIKSRGFAIKVEQLSDMSGTVYEKEVAVIVRPDFIVAAHVTSGDAADPSKLLEAVLPLAI